MLAGVLGLVSCTSSGQGDPMAAARQALADTESVALRAGDEPTETAREGVDRFIALFSSFEASSLDAGAASVYAEDAYFNDGFVEVRGLDEITTYLVRSAEAAGEVAIEVQDVAYSGAEIYIRWDMRFTNRKGSTEVKAPGVSHLRLDRDGKVVFHRDYWDASGALAEFVPLMPSILRSVRSRL